MSEFNVRAASVACGFTPTGGMGITVNVAGGRVVLNIDPPAADDRDGLDALGLMGVVLFQVYARTAIRQLDARLPPEEGGRRGGPSRDR